MACFSKISIYYTFSLFQSRQEGFKKERKKENAFCFTNRKPDDDFNVIVMPCFLVLFVHLPGDTVLKCSHFFLIPATEISQLLLVFTPATIREFAVFHTLYEVYTAL